MNTLEHNLQLIDHEKTEKIIPENIKKDVKIFDVVGSYIGESALDATATQDDIINPKTAYVNNQKITGNIQFVQKDEISSEENSMNFSDATSLGNTNTMFQDIDYEDGLAIRLNKTGTLEVYSLEDGSFTENSKKSFSYSDLGISVFNTGSCKFIGKTENQDILILLCCAKVSTDINYNAYLLSLSVEDNTISKISELDNIISIIGRRTENATGAWNFYQEVIRRVKDNVFIFALTSSPGVGFVSTNWKFYHATLEIIPSSNNITLNNSGDIIIGSVARGDDWNPNYPHFTNCYVSGDYLVMSAYIYDRGDGKNYYSSIFLDINSNTVTYKTGTNTNQGYVLYNNKIYGNNNIYNVKYPNTSIGTCNFSFLGTSDALVTKSYIFVYNNSSVTQYDENLESINTYENYSHLLIDTVNNNLLLLGDASGVSKKITIIPASLTRLGITYINTSDANAIGEDIFVNKTAYVNGEKITGSAEQIFSSNAYSIEYKKPAPEASEMLTVSYKALGHATHIPVGEILDIWIDESELASIIGLTSDKIKSGETILGITGTYDANASL